MTKPNLKVVSFTEGEEREESPDDEVQAIWSKLIDLTSGVSDALSGREPRTQLPTSSQSSDGKTGMSTPTREEFEARLETVEARMDARVARIEGKIDAFMAQAAERDKRLEILAEHATKAAEQAGSLKSNMWLAAITVVIAVVGTYYATQSSNIGMTQAVIAAFQQGQNSSTPPPKKP
ncbi:hypothetical protein RI103_06110 [Paraburkholderia sp. FT54]|uniref:hypothetical protein n=1 Tax=Paraburkholderia sp. FT54 TaxID=3074437 RepID=UPI0028775C06|nr:hypothetical protein [Paraburkholderia sp. FT54]WNC90921.1 hypothetical protein RI103_06110 [Paraburkholderia sp. FT54]